MTQQEHQAAIDPSIADKIPFTPAPHVSAELEAGRFSSEARQAFYAATEETIGIDEFFRRYAFTEHAAAEITDPTTTALLRILLKQGTAEDVALMRSPELMGVFVNHVLTPPDEPTTLAKKVSDAGARDYPHFLKIVKGTSTPPEETHNDVDDDDFDLTLTRTFVNEVGVIREALCGAFERADDDLKRIEESTGPLTPQQTRMAHNLKVAGEEIKEMAKKEKNGKEWQTLLDLIDRVQATLGKLSDRLLEAYRGELRNRAKHNSDTDAKIALKIAYDWLSSLPEKADSDITTYPFKVLEPALRIKDALHSDTHVTRRTEHADEKATHVHQERGRIARSVSPTELQEIRAALLGELSESFGEPELRDVVNAIYEAIAQVNGRLAELQAHAIIRQATAWQAVAA